MHGDIETGKESTVFLIANIKPWMSHNVPEAVGILLLGLTSCLWGFALVLAFRFVFTHLPSRHADVA
jgi:hypothetical protein